MTDLVSTQNLIEALEVKSKAAKLKILMPTIIKNLNKGISHKQIVDTLNQSGTVNISLATFRKYLYIYRKKNSKKINQKTVKVNKVISKIELKSQSEQLKDILNARRNGTFGDKYITRSRPIIGF